MRRAAGILTDDSPTMDLNFSALRCGSITLYRIHENNSSEVLERFMGMPGGAFLAQELTLSYLPRYDAVGRQTKFGFYAEIDGELAGASLLGISSWRDLRGYTGADTLPDMRGQGVAPGSKPALFYLGFILLGLNRVETGCFASNESSRRSIEKTPGLKFEGILREFARNERGEFEDEYRYAILRRDWEALYREVQVDLVRQEPGA